MKKVWCLLLVVVLFSFSITTGDAKVHTPAHYEYTIRQCFKEKRWSAGKVVLDEANTHYADMGVFMELTGWWYYHEKNYIYARRYLVNSLHDDNSNTHARELLVNVEEETKHYSAAICYINELLERDAYNKRLWIRKIRLNKLLHNDVEASKLTTRLYEIYPNDKDIQNMIGEQYENEYKKNKKIKNTEGEINSLRQLCNIQPKNYENYLVLSNLYLQMGNISDALAISRKGAIITHNSTLIKKHTGILCSQGNYQAALSFLDEVNAGGNFRDDILEEQAQYDNANDPYTAYGRIYDKTHSRESFLYLVSTAISRGYYYDGLDYIKDYLKHNSVTEDILYKQYILYKLTNNSGKELSTLEQLYKMNPKNEDVVYELTTLYYDKANWYIENEQYKQAVNVLDFVYENAKDSDMVESSGNKLYNCYVSIKDYDRAMNYADTNYKKENLYVLQNKYKDAYSIIEDSTDYEEISIPYIKQLMKNKEYDEALTVIDTVLQYSNAKELYMYGISASVESGKDYSGYIYKGISQYPDDSYFISQYSGLQMDLADSLISENEYDSAMVCVDTALVYDPDNRELLYKKGIIYEKMHDYELAYDYQKKYIPSDDESFLFKQHLKGLSGKMSKNTLTFDYIQARPSKEDVKSSNAAVQYEHSADKHAWRFSLNYAGRDDETGDDLLYQQTPGGIGLLFGAGYTYNFKKDYTLDIDASYGTKYFAKGNLKLNLTKVLNDKYSVNGYIQYRKLDSYDKIYSDVTDEQGVTSQVFSGWKQSYMNMFSLGLGISINNYEIVSDLKIHAHILDKHPYYAFSGMIGYKPDILARTKIYGLVNIGTAPEASLISSSMPTSFEKINASLGAGVSYSLTNKITLGLEGNWYTMYKQDRSNTLYVNYLYIHPTITFSF